MAKKTKEVMEGASADLLKLDDIIGKQFEDIQSVSDDDENVSVWYDWGNYALNYISSKNLFNGVPSGRITSVKGLSGTGKSLLLASVIKDPKVDMVVGIEAEGAGFTKDLLQFAGADIKKLRRIHCSTFENYKTNKKTGSIEEVPDEKFPKTKDTDDYKYEEGATRLVKRFLSQLEFNGIKANIIIVLDSLANLQSVREKSGCYHPDTLLQTMGVDKNVVLKKIKDVEEGNKVLTHLGSFEKVEKVHTLFSNDLIEIETELGDFIKLTPEHPMLVDRNGDLVWIKAGELTITDVLQIIK